MADLITSLCNSGKPYTKFLSPIDAEPANLKSCERSIIFILAFISLSIYDGYDKYVFKRSVDKSGNIFYNNPIFKLDFQKSENVNTESEQNYDSRSNFKLHEETYDLTKKQIKTECYKCHGSGKQTCWHCNGKGEVKCENCFGTGIYNYTGKTCNQCNGNGKHYCRDCNGNGIDGMCYNCRGEGFIYQ